MPVAVLALRAGRRSYIPKPGTMPSIASTSTAQKFDFALGYPHGALGHSCFYHASRQWRCKPPRSIYRNVTHIGVIVCVWSGIGGGVAHERIELCTKV